MRHIARSTDADLSFDLQFDRKTVEFVVVDKAGKEHGRFSVPDVLLEYERINACSLRSHSTLHPCARVNMAHGEADRANELEERRIAAFRRWSHQQITRPTYADVAMSAMMVNMVQPELDRRLDEQIDSMWEDSECPGQNENQ
jgi:hypothetical protein